MKRLVKEDNYRGEWLALALEYSEKALDYLKRAASVADKAEYSNFFEELKSHADNVENTLYDLRNIVDGLSKEEYATPVSESTNEWFSKTGELVQPLPGDCIMDCSHGGSVDADVDHWVNALPGFLDQFKTDDGILAKAKEHLGHMGDYEPEGMDATEVAMVILWDACCHFKEEAVQVADYGSRYDEDYEYPGDISEWSDEDWEHFQMNELGYYLGD